MRAGKQSSGLFYRSAPATEDEVRGDSVSVYQAFRDVNTAGDGQVPAPRSIDGKCGAVLAAEKLIREMNVGDEAEFDDKFSEILYTTHPGITTDGILNRLPDWMMEGK